MKSKKISGSEVSVAVIGSTSLVGSRFCELVEKKIKLTTAALDGGVKIDITDPASVDEFFRKNASFDYFLNFAAFTDVDAAEAERNNKEGLCWKINVLGSKNLAEAAIKYNKFLISISTDFIFDGTAGPYAEDAQAGPDFNKVSWYGQTKYYSEEEIKAVENHLIIRIAYPYRANYKNKQDFARNILQRAKENKLYPFFDDQQFTPTFIDDLPLAVLHLIKNEKKGAYHLASPEVTTPYEFAKHLLETFGFKTEDMEKSSLSEFLKKSPTPRPIRGGLLCTKLIEEGFEPSTWMEGIKKLKEQQKELQLI